MMFGLVTASCQKWPPAPSAFASRRKKSPMQRAFCKRLIMLATIANYFVYRHKTETEARKDAVAARSKLGYEE